RSPVSKASARGDLIRAASVVIWDEAPMANRAVLSCVEEICRDVMESDAPFGGKVIILLGDFRQTCPVIPYGTKAQVI
ncbi:DNA helicase Pif1 like protein, partial [Irpex rosettiformis]